MQKNESEKSEVTPEKALPDKVDSHAEKKQRDQAIAGLDDGLLNKQQQDTLADQQSTGKTKVTGFGKNRDGTGGLPSGESIFGDAKNQAALRDAWTGKDQRKQELLKEIMEANAQGKLVSDGGFIASVSKPEYQSPLYRDSEMALIKAFPSIYGKDRLPIPARPAHSDPPGGKPDESGDEGDKEPPPGSIVGGGAPPPGDDETRRRLSDPNYDPDHGTLWEFVRKHTYLPANESPQAPLEKRDRADGDEEKHREKEKERLQPPSGLSSEIYRRTTDGKLLSPAEVARHLNLNTRTDLLDDLTAEDLKKLGLERIPKERTDATVADRLESIVEKTAVIENGRITPESGLKACDHIRETLRTFCSDIDKKNISFVIAEIAGKRQVFVSVNNKDSLAPGTMPPVGADRIFTYDPGAGRPTENHSEAKLLEQLAPHVKPGDSIALFTEQDPCKDSCAFLINEDFPVETGAYVSTSSVYPDQVTRTAGVAERVRKYRAAQRGGNHD